MDTTIGSMAVFFRDNLDYIMRSDLRFRSRKYIKETIFKYKDLRNGYFHKDNIHDPKKIDEIREATYNLLFLVLGAEVLSSEELQALKYPMYVYPDFYRLCEYVNYHAGELFYLDFGDREELGLGCADPLSKVDNGHIQYSGVYIKEAREGGGIFPFSEDTVPSKVALGKFVFGFDENNKNAPVSIEPIKVKTVFENGKYTGPAIAAEEKLNY